MTQDSTQDSASFVLDRVGASAWLRDNAQLDGAGIEHFTREIAKWGYATPSMYRALPTLSLPTKNQCARAICRLASCGASVSSDIAA